MFQERYIPSSAALIESPIARQIWQSKYRYKSKGRKIDRVISDTWLRVASALAKSEAPSKREMVTNTFFDAMRSYKLLPGGRILAGAGTKRSITLCNTFVMREIPDSVEGIMDVAKQAALTMKMGGGIGFDFSTIRPRGGYVSGLDCPAAGPVAVMEICDAVCKMVVSGMGRGAMMATLRCDHPDIEAFVHAKSAPAMLRNFNVSVLVTDKFMQAVERGETWDLTWNDVVIRQIDAQKLWHLIMQRNYEAAEPGVLFIDRINDGNALNYLEQISATNSCAEQPLPPNGACPLASINLARFVRHPFERNSVLDIEELRSHVSIAVRLLDNVLEVSDFAVEEQRDEVNAKRRIGIGVTGLADALIMLGLRYGSQPAVEATERWMRVLQNAAYTASARLAEERGAFPLYSAAKHLKQPTIQNLDPETRRAVIQNGLRNGLLTTIAPTGTTSMYAGNVSSGIEPVFAFSFKRLIGNPDGTKSVVEIEDYALSLFRKMRGGDAELTEAFVTSQDLTPSDHVAMQAAAQKWVDSGISKTVNCPEDISFESFKDIYAQASASGCKGCTTFRPNDITGSILSV